MHEPHSLMNGFICAAKVLEFVAAYGIEPDDASR